MRLRYFRRKAMFRQRLTYSRYSNQIYRIRIKTGYLGFSTTFLSSIKRLVFRTYRNVSKTEYCHMYEWLIDGVLIGVSIYSPLIHSRHVTTLYSSLLHTHQSSQSVVSTSRCLVTDFNTGIITVSLNYTLQTSHIKSSIRRLSINWLSSKSKSFYDRYPLDKGLGGPQSQFGWRGENFSPYQDSDPSIVQPVARLYSDCANPATKSTKYSYI
jgi:hypothetical protein